MAQTFYLFIDPQQPSDVLSPWLPQHKFPKLIHDIYASCLNDPSHKKELLDLTDPFLLKKTFELLYSQELHHNIKNILQKGISFLSPLPYRTNVSYHFKPSAGWKNERQAFLFGIDLHGYGWNLVGQSLQSKSKNDFTCYQYETYVNHYLQKFRTAILPPFVLEQSFEQTQEEHEIVNIALDYDSHPWNLYFLLCRKYVPSFPSRIDKMMTEIILRELGDDIRKDMTDATNHFLLRNKCLYLYHQKKLPISSQTCYELEELKARKQSYSMDVIQKYCDFMPFHPPSSSVIEFDENHPLFLSIFGKPFISSDGKHWDHIFQYLLYEIINPYIGQTMAEKKCRLSLSEIIETNRMSHILDWSLNKFIKTRIRQLIEHRLRTNLCLVVALLKTHPSPLRYIDPYDYFLGFHPNNPYSNQIGIEYEYQRNMIIQRFNKNHPPSFLQLRHCMLEYLFLRFFRSKKTAKTYFQSVFTNRPITKTQLIQRFQKLPKSCLVNDKPYLRQCVADLVNLLEQFHLLH